MQYQHLFYTSINYFISKCVLLLSCFQPDESRVIHFAGSAVVIIYQGYHVFVS